MVVFKLSSFALYTSAHVRLRIARVTSTRSLIHDVALFTRTLLISCRSRSIRVIWARQTRPIGNASPEKVPGAHGAVAAGRRGGLVAKPRRALARVVQLCIPLTPGVAGACLGHRVRVLGKSARGAAVFVGNVGFLKSRCTSGTWVCAKIRVADLVLSILVYLLKCIQRFKF